MAGGVCPSGRGATMALVVLVAALQPTLAVADSVRLRGAASARSRQGVGSGSGSGSEEKPPWWLPTPPEWGPVPAHIFTSYYHQPYATPQVVGLHHPGLMPYWYDRLGPTVVDLGPGDDPKKLPPAPEEPDPSLPKWLQKPVWWTTTPPPHAVFPSTPYNPATLPHPVYSPGLRGGMYSHGAFGPLAHHPVWYGAYGHNYWQSHQPTLMPTTLPPNYVVGHPYTHPPM